MRAAMYLVANCVLFTGLNKITTIQSCAQNRTMFNRCIYLHGWIQAGGVHPKMHSMHLCLLLLLVAAAAAAEAAEEARCSGHQYWDGTECQKCSRKPCGVGMYRQRCDGATSTSDSECLQCKPPPDPNGMHITGGLPFMEVWHHHSQSERRIPVLHPLLPSTLRSYTLSL